MGLGIGMGQEKQKRKPNWSRRKPGRPKKKRWMPPRIGRSNYDRFRADEFVAVANDIRDIVDKERIHEKRPGGRGKPPAKKRDIIKCLLFLEQMRCVIPKSTSLLYANRDILGLENIPAPRTLYDYRAMPSTSSTLKRLQWMSARPLWLREDAAAIDATGNPHSNGGNWRRDKTDPNKFREYDKTHYVVGVKSCVIPVTKVTRGSWSEIPEFEPLLTEAAAEGNIKTAIADSGLVAIENYEASRNLGATPYIKPKDNAVFRPHPSNAYERAVYFATKFPERFKEEYRWRTKAECAIHAKKAAFGDIIRGRLPSSRRNQELCRDIVHNLRMVAMARYGG